jgi:hypothetical protein
MISLSLKIASAQVVNVAIFLDGCSETVTRFKKKELADMYTSVVDKSSLLHLLSDIYGEERIAATKAIADIEAIDGGDYVKLVSFKEEKQNCDGKTIVDISFVSKSNIKISREGTFAPRKQMDKYYNYYYVEDKEEY